MAQDKRQVDAITARDVDFAQWYTDVCTKAELIDYSSSRACSSTAPTATPSGRISRRSWTSDSRRRPANGTLPMLSREPAADEAEGPRGGLRPGVRWVTVGGSEKLEERCCIRPTSETPFCEHYKNIIHSHRDLPSCTTSGAPSCAGRRPAPLGRPSCRTGVLWQEGHTMHGHRGGGPGGDHPDAEHLRDFLENVLAMPVVKGRKTDKEKFNGREETYTVECMMHDKKALQAGTSHYYGDGFAGPSTSPSPAPTTSSPPPPDLLGRVHRMIGGIIMTHGDDNGLVLPPGSPPSRRSSFPWPSTSPGSPSPPRTSSAVSRPRGPGQNRRER